MPWHGLFPKSEEKTARVSMEDFIDEMIGSIQTFLRQLKEKNCHKGSRCGCQSGSSYNRRTRKLFVGKIFSGSENEEILCCS